MELIATLELILNVKANIDYQPMQTGDVNFTFADNRKLREAINYQPETPLNKGLELFCLWLKDFINDKENESIIT